MQTLEAALKEFTQQEKMVASRREQINLNTKTSRSNKPVAPVRLESPTAKLSPAMLRLLNKAIGDFSAAHVDTVPSATGTAQATPNAPETAGTNSLLRRNFIQGLLHNQMPKLFGQITEILKSHLNLSSIAEALEKEDLAALAKALPVEALHSAGIKLAALLGKPMPTMQETVAEHRKLIGLASNPAIAKFFYTGLQSLMSKNNHEDATTPNLIDLAQAKELIAAQAGLDARTSSQNAAGN